MERPDFPRIYFSPNDFPRSYRFIKALLLIGDVYIWSPAPFAMKHHIRLEEMGKFITNGAVKPIGKPNFFDPKWREEKLKPLWNEGGYDEDFDPIVKAAVPLEPDGGNSFDVNASRYSDILVETKPELSNLIGSLKNSIPGDVKRQQQNQEKLRRLIFNVFTDEVAFKSCGANMMLFPNKRIATAYQEVYKYKSELILSSLEPPPPTDFLTTTYDAVTELKVFLYDISKNQPLDLFEFREYRGHEKLGNILWKSMQTPTGSHLLNAKALAEFTQIVEHMLAKGNTYHHLQKMMYLNLVDKLLKYSMIFITAWLSHEVAINPWILNFLAEQLFGNELVRGASKARDYLNFLLFSLNIRNPMYLWLISSPQSVRKGAYVSHGIYIP